MHPPKRAPPVLLLLLGAGMACGDRPGPTDAVPVPVATCRGQAAVEHQGTIDAEAWSSSTAHLLTDTVIVAGRLTVAAGGLVCGARGAVLQVQREAELIAEGTADQPIIFTATNPGEPWGGIGVADPGEPYALYGMRGRINHAVIEHAELGIVGEWIITNTRVRQIRNAGIILAGGSLARSRVDSALTQPSSSTFMGTSVTILSSAGAVIEETAVRGGGGHGIDVYDRSSVRLRDVVIEGNAGTGLRVAAEGGREAHLQASGLRITGNGGYPAHVSMRYVDTLMAATNGGRNLLGNAQDTLVVSGYGDAVVSAILPWRIAPTQWPGTGVLTLQPGAIVTFDSSLVRGLIARGTAEEPIVLKGTRVEIGGPPFLFSTIFLSHVRVEGLPEFVLHGPGTEIADAVLAQSGLILNSSGTRMERVSIQDAPGSGVTIRDVDVLIADCEISGSAGHGIHIVPLWNPASELPGPSLRISQCNLVDNVGDGIHDTRGDSVDARNNWWGDPAGPEGPLGDGVSGNVDTSGWATGPFSWPWAASGVRRR